METDRRVHQRHWCILCGRRTGQSRVRAGISSACAGHRRIVHCTELHAAVVVPAVRIFPLVSLKLERMAIYIAPPTDLYDVPPDPVLCGWPPARCHFNHGDDLQLHLRIRALACLQSTSRACVAWVVNGGVGGCGVETHLSLSLNAKSTNATPPYFFLVGLFPLPPPQH